MRLRIFLEDTDKWLKWAKRQLARLNEYRKDVNLPILKRSLVPETGTRVDLVSADTGDWIRIFGAPKGWFFYGVRSVGLGLTVVQLQAILADPAVLALLALLAGVSVAVLTAQFQDEIARIESGAASGTVYALYKFPKNSSPINIFVNSDGAPPFIRSVAGYDVNQFLYWVQPEAGLVIVDKDGKKNIKGENQYTGFIDAVVAKDKLCLLYDNSDNTASVLLSGDKRLELTSPSGFIRTAIYSTLTDFYVIRGAGFLAGSTSSVFGLTEQREVFRKEYDVDFEVVAGANFGQSVPAVAGTYDRLFWVTSVFDSEGFFIAFRVYCTSDSLSGVVPILLYEEAVSAESLPSFGFISATIATKDDFFLVTTETTSGDVPIDPDLFLNTVYIHRFAKNVSPDGVISYTHSVVSFSFEAFTPENGSDTNVAGVSVSADKCYVYVRRTASTLSDLFLAVDILCSDGTQVNAFTIDDDDPIFPSTTTGFLPISDGRFDFYSFRGHAYFVTRAITLSAENFTRFVKSDGTIVDIPDEAGRTFSGVPSQYGSATELYIVVVFTGGTPIRRVLGSDGTAFYPEMLDDPERSPAIDPDQYPTQLKLLETGETSTGSTLIAKDGIVYAALTITRSDGNHQFLVKLPEQEVIPYPLPIRNRPSRIQVPPLLFQRDSPIARMEELELWPEA